MSGAGWRHVHTRGGWPLAVGAALAISLSSACGDAFDSRDPSDGEAGGASTGGSATGGTGGKGTGGDALEQACRAHATPICAAIADCAAGYFASNWKDTEECADAGTRNCVAHRMGPGSTVTAKDLEACAGSVSALSCDSVTSLFVPNEFVPSEACVFHGTLPIGASCLADEQCESARCHREGGEQTCGACAEVSGQGEPCDGNFVCAYGLHCSAGGCIPFGQVGSKCNPRQNPDPSLAPCRSGLACVGGSCATPKKDGEACNTDYAECRVASVCNFLSKVCEPIDFTAQVGESCGVTLAGGLRLCGYGGICRIDNAVTYMGSCAPRAQEGQACDATATYVAAPDSCAFPSQCLEGTCRITTAASCT